MLTRLRDSDSAAKTDATIVSNLIFMDLSFDLTYISSNVQISPVSKDSRGRA